jgi:hypothetical protein
MEIKNLFLNANVVCLANGVGKICEVSNDGLIFSVLFDGLVCNYDVYGRLIIGDSADIVTINSILNLC